MGNFPPTPEQFRAMNLTRTIVCVPSFIGSAYIVFHVLVSKERRSGTKTRVLLCMSIMDILFALITFMNFFLPPIPHLRRRVLFPDGSELEAKPYDTGTPSQLACTAVGFFTQGGRLSSILYNCSLTLYYLLVIRYGWTEKKIKTKAEPYLHAIPLLLGWGTAITCLILKLYNPTPTGCDIDSFPPGCFGGPRCTRARNALTYVTYFFFVPLWLAFCFLVVAMVLIYLKILAVENKSNRHDAVLSAVQRDRNQQRGSFIKMISSKFVLPKSFIKTGNNSPTTAVVLSKAKEASAMKKKREMSRGFGVQAFLYCMSFAASWTCFSFMIILILGEGSPKWTGLLFASNCLAPLQGFWNCIVYVRPRWINKRKQQKQSQQSKMQQTTNWMTSSSTKEEARQRFLMRKSSASVFSDEEACKIYEQCDRDRQQAEDAAALVEGIESSENEMNDDESTTSVDPELMDQNEMNDDESTTSVDPELMDQKEMNDDESTTSVDPELMDQNEIMDNGERDKSLLPAPTNRLHVAIVDLTTGEVKIGKINHASGDSRYSAKSVNGSLEYSAKSVNASQANDSPGHS